MSDVFKNIADAAGSSSVRRGFADLFSASKAALDEIQAGLGGILPSMPGMPVAKFGDLSIGIDMHPTVTPPSPIMPVPHVGKVYDLMADLMAGMAAAMPPAADGVAGVACNILKSMAPSVKVHNQWIAQAGIGIVHLPAFVLHPAPLVSGMSEPPRRRRASCRQGPLPAARAPRRGRRAAPRSSPDGGSSRWATAQVSPERRAPSAR